MMKQWEVWYAEFPYEEDNSIIKVRPVIILNADNDKLECLSVKVTTHDVRENDEYDTPIIHWAEAGLKQPSVARVSKTMILTVDKFKTKKGDLHPDDIQTVMNRFMAFMATK
ncbi:MAG: type II toxin-antitoxin system PemK/MazF family toxin [Roseburia sp.]|nr:type II toxin-antitoxin system PemK/MazF family toxin [Roseburia sp.]MCM1098532.1 type II toxin-antitoxin system PemK/MazF family toxin [Ruminococcus flavefaciens]